MLGLFALVIAGLWLAAAPSHPRTVRYRLTLNVETPEGLKSGSSVVEVTEYYADGAIREFDSSSAGVRFHGQATMVDLGARGLLFCVLQFDLARNPKAIGRPIDLPATYFHQLIPKYEWSPELYDKLNSLRPPPKRDIAPNDLPLLVRFRDPTDSRTVERVEPDRLDAAFGQGVRLASATVEITRDDVTMGVEKKLMWLRSNDELHVVSPDGPMAIDLTPTHQLLYWDFWGEH
jgi:hypothetical protein